MKALAFVTDQQDFLTINNRPRPAYGGLTIYICDVYAGSAQRTGSERLRSISPEDDNIHILSASGTNYFPIFLSVGKMESNQTNERN